MFFRMKVRRVKGLVWLMNIAMILGIIGLFFAIYKKKSDKVFKPRDWELFRNEVKKGFDENRMEKLHKVIDFADYAALWNAPISG